MEIASLRDTLTQDLLEKLKASFPKETFSIKTSSTRNDLRGCAGFGFYDHCISCRSDTICNNKNPLHEVSFNYQWDEKKEVIYVYLVVLRRTEQVEPNKFMLTREGASVVLRTNVQADHVLSEFNEPRFRRFETKEELEDFLLTTICTWFGLKRE